jgi:beta-galactosidase
MLLAQSQLLDPTLSLTAVDGITVPYQNGMPVPSFEKQRRMSFSLGGIWRKQRFTANNAVTLVKRSADGILLLASDAAGRQTTGYTDGAWETMTLPAIENNYRCRIRCADGQARSVRAQTELSESV